MKCQAKVRSGKYCDRDSILDYEYCQQHIEIQCKEHQRLKIPQNIKSKLIPDLENLIIQYLTPYEYYELIDINTTHTPETYKLHQKKYEKLTANKIIAEYNQQLQDLQRQYNNAFREYKQEIDQK